MSQAGMARHHLRKKEPGWRKGLFVNGTGAVMSLVVDIIILLTKFTHGAWVVVVLVPVMVYALTRLNKQYEAEAHELAEDAPKAAEAPILSHHVVFVLIDNLDLASARAIQYARSLVPDELRAVHFIVDADHAARLTENWQKLGLSRLPLELIECPDRRLSRAAVELVAQTLAGGDTEVSVLLPHMQYTKLWHRLLHDRTSDQIASALADLPHANVTLIPYHLGNPERRRSLAKALSVAGRNGRDSGSAKRAAAVAPDVVSAAEVPEGATPIAEVSYRQRARVAGRVRSMRVQPWSGVATLECTIVDRSGAIDVVFLGRKQVAGIAPGARLVVEGMVGDHRGRLAILNPEYRILAAADEHELPPAHH
jgi:hypothetical protein